MALSGDALRANFAAHLEQTFSRPTSSAQAGGDKKTMAATVGEGTAPKPVQVNAEASGGRSNSGNVKYAASPSKKAPEPRQQVATRESIPWSDQAEQGVLGAILQMPDLVPVAVRNMTPHFFYSPPHRTIYETLLRLHSRNAAIDLITFTTYLRDTKQLDNVGGPAYIAQLFTSASLGLSTPEHLEYYIAILRDKFILRELILTGTNMTRAAYGADASEVSELIDSFAAQIERMKHTAGGPNGSERFEWDAIEMFDPKSDPDNLIGNRWLVRGDAQLLAGGSGYGKSSLEMQFAIYWAAQEPCFGLRPVRPMKSIIVQAENNIGDVSEHYQGVIKGISSAGDLDVQAKKELIQKNVGIHRVIGKTGADFLNLFDTLLEIDRPDLAWIDPLFAFSGCDLLNPEKTGRFLREGLFPIVNKRRVGLIVLHHVGKPVRDKGASATMSDIDYQYLGFGSSEIQNAFRGVNILVPVGGSSVYKLVFSKRGERAGARDFEGSWARSIFLEHSRDGICWLQCKEPEGREKTVEASVILDEMSVVDPVQTKVLQERLRDEENVTKSSFYRRWDELKSDKKIKKVDGGWVRVGSTGSNWSHEPF